MKKIVLIIGCFLTFLEAKAQVALSLLSDTPISNGQIFTYNTAEYPANTLYYKIKNTSSTPIDVRFKIIGLVNNTGSSFQVCYDPNCIPFVSLNQVFPPLTKPPISLGANGSTSGDGYNLANFDTGNGVNYPLDYVVKYYMVDANGNETGTPFIITYRYNPNAMGVNEANSQNKFAKILNTKIGNSVTISSTEKGEYQIHNGEGRMILSGKINAGINSIDSGPLKNGIYFITIKDSKGNALKVKLLK